MYQPTKDEQAWLDTLPPYQAEDWLKMMNDEQEKADALGITVAQYELFCQEYFHSVDDGWDMTMTKEQYVAECAAQLKGA